MYDVVFVMTTHPTHSYHKYKLKPVIVGRHFRIHKFKLITTLYKSFFVEFMSLVKQQMICLALSDGQTMRSLIFCLFTQIFLILASVLVCIAHASLNQAGCSTSHMRHLFIY